MNIETISLPALQDNYIWVLVNKIKMCCVVVDPSEAEPVLNFLTSNQLVLSAILVTHHHWDHTGGIDELVQNYSVPVFGPALESIPHCTDKVNDQTTIDLPCVGLTFQVIETPGHTKGHVCYYGNKSLFCGDTLFTCGCGKAFEGTPAQLYHSLCKLSELPDDTSVYCGHEYTQKNIEFALGIDMDNPILQYRRQLTEERRGLKLPTVPSTMQLEKETNPFLRCDVAPIRKAVEAKVDKKLNTPEEVFEAMRNLKNLMN